MPRKYLILIHLTFWVFKIGTTVYLFKLPHLNERYELSLFIYQNITEWSFTMIWFYFNYYFVIPKLFFTKKYGFFVLAELFLCYFNISIKYFIWTGFETQNIFLPPLSSYYSLFSDTTLFLATSFTLRIMDKWLDSELERTQLETALKKAELSFLNYQISPHFLFNTLNNIYGLALKKKPKTNNSISSLRYLLQINNKNKSYSLQDEIKAIKSFIKLNQLRYSVKVDFHTSITKNPKIDPMIFLPFFENAFKHGQISSNNLITAVLTEHKDKIGFTISNLIADQGEKDNVGGIGIENIKKRLQIRYPNKHSVNIDSRNNSFTINININAK